ncbi:MAG: CTP synthetase [Pseudomonadota bacterium]|jgi:predicted PurR-regulated permease PerM
MFRLATILFSVISTTLMGSGVIAVLSLGHDTLWPILIAAAAGFVLAIPVSWWVARQILSGSTFVK